MNENDILDSEQPVQNDNILFEPVEGSAENLEVIEEEETAADPVTEQGEESGSASVSEVVEVVKLPNYSVENPLPVYIVEDEEPVEQTELEVFSLTGSYHGTISDTYLDYFEGIVEKLKPNENYVVWRSGQYAYNMCYGENIELDGTFFSGDCDLVQIYRSPDNYSNDWYVSTGSDSLSLSATDIFCYSNLGMYPTLERGAKHGESITFLLAFCVFTVFVLAHSIFDYIVKYIYRK